MANIVTVQARTRLPREARRQQLLEVARKIVEEEGADRLSLGYLAGRANISKPVVYDHFATRNVLLIELYRWIDREFLSVFREAMGKEERNLTDTADIVAATYLRCASDLDGEFHKIGTALSGSDEKAAVFQELLDECAAMIASVLQPHSHFSPRALTVICVGFVGCGEALAGAMVRKKVSAREAQLAFATIIYQTLVAGTK